MLKDIEWEDYDGRVVISATIDTDTGRVTEIYKTDWHGNDLEVKEGDIDEAEYRYERAYVHLRNPI